MKRQGAVSENQRGPKAAHPLNLKLSGLGGWKESENSVVNRPDNECRDWLMSQGQGRDKIKLMVVGLMKEEARLLTSSYMYMTCSGTLPCWTGYFVNRFEQISVAEDPWMSLFCSGAVCQNGVLHPPSASVCREDSNLLMQPEALLAQWQNLCWQQCFELRWWPACVLERCQITKSVTVCVLFFLSFLFVCICLNQVDCVH